jgi:hypothetical protein
MCGEAVRKMHSFLLTAQHQGAVSRDEFLAQFPDPITQSVTHPATTAMAAMHGEVLAGAELDLDRIAQLPMDSLRGLHAQHFLFAEHYAALSDESGGTPPPPEPPEPGP